MSSTVQSLIAATLVLAALVYLARNAWVKVVRPKKRQPACGADCGCEH